MSAPLPPRTRAEQIAYNAEVMRQQQLAQPNVRLSRRNRRVVVISTYAALAVMLVTLATGLPGAPDRSAPMLWGLMLIVLSICVLVLEYSVGGLTRKNAMLDERERAQRDHATAIAYSTLTALVGALLTYAIAANLFNTWWLPLPRAVPQLGPFAIAGIWFVTTMPKAILAWTLPDPDPDSVG